MARKQTYITGFLPLLLSIATTAALDPYAPGPLNTSHTYISALVTAGLQEDLDVWVPAVPGTYPTLYFIDSFGGYTPASLYQEFGHFVASHGVTVVAPWSLNLPLNPVDKVPIFASVLDWAEANLEEKLHAKGLDEGVHLDLENLVLSGHSAGSHVLVEYLKGGCGKVKAQVFVSPVDGVDPLGLIPEFCITPGEYLNYAMPTLHIEGGFDALPGASGVACAPDELSNIRFYNAANPELAARWHINTTQYGHADLLDDSAIALVESSGFCAWNPDLSLEDHDAYRRFVGGSVVVFMKAVFTTDEAACSTYMSYLQDPNLMNVEVTNMYDNLSGMCPTPTCTWSPLPTTAAPATTAAPPTTAA